MADAGQFAELALALIGLHYDSAYDRARKKLSRALVGEAALDPCDPAALEAAAGAVAVIMSTLDAADGERESER
jgi:hypothetical protein